MEVIILVGGLGTRLSHIVKDVPKPMAPVGDVPFLVHVFEYLLKFEVKRVVLATSYKTEIIEGFLGNNYKGIGISYSIETEPLGTGGGIKKALTCCSREDVCVLNGDTYFNVDLIEMQKYHKKNNAILTVALKKMYNFDRYGTVEVDGNSIVKFNEKKKEKEGYINGGIYFIKRDSLNGINEKVFSFEKNYLEKFVLEGLFKGFISDGYFIDIGVPEDYYRANNELKLKK